MNEWIVSCQVLVDAIGLTLGHLRGAEEPLLTNRDALSVLMKLVARADRLMAEDDAVLMSQSDVEDLLRQFYEDDAVDVALRLRLLEMLPAEYQPPSDAVEGSFTFTIATKLFELCWTYCVRIVVTKTIPTKFY